MGRVKRDDQPGLGMEFAAVSDAIEPVRKVMGAFGVNVIIGWDEPLALLRCTVVAWLTAADREFRTSYSVDGRDVLDAPRAVLENLPRVASAVLLSNLARMVAGHVTQEATDGRPAEGEAT